MKRLIILILVAGIISPTINARRHSDNVARIPYADWVTIFADSQMENDPELWQADGMKAPKWDYTQTLVAKAMLEAYRLNGNEEYLKYVQAFADYFIQPDGSILTYKKETYNIDRVNGGTFLYVMNELQPEARFEQAIDTLYSQLLTHPRTQEGGFWHKKIYPHQMWLDGLYMAEPFYCRYAREHELTEGLEDVARQFALIDSHTYDSVSGLNYHGWDESREQQWADSITGCSPHFWGRSMGWYLMAMVDVLDYMPDTMAGYQQIKQMLERSAANLLRYQDKKTHLWYQVLDRPEAEGNYQEATCSAIFCYVFAKAANRGYLPKQYRREAERIYDGLVSNLINATVVIKDVNQIYIKHAELTECCAVAGLGGNPYRDGSYEYYINEKKRSDDPKGIGPLILALIELAK